MNTIILKDNIDEATAAELQKYMEDHGITDIHMVKTGDGWCYSAKIRGGAVLGGGPLPNMSDCMKAIIHKIEEA